MTNRLAREPSPYLRQHADNPVDWYPWGDEAFRKAREEDKPLFVSVGYATCHWCHVMERESFGDDEAAALLNDVCVPVKVDREERPDVDGLLMAVSQVMNGSGGWPLNVLLTPAGLPFFAATYLPKRERKGMPGLMEILPRIKWLWRTQREQVEQSAASIRDALAGAGADEPGPCPGLAEADRAFEGRRRASAPEFGGFSRTIKFPMASHLLFLAEYGARRGSAEALAMAEHTLAMMWRGGIRDPLGGGLARYATDRRWLVPHFEKMLYDQALVLFALARMEEITPDALWKSFATDLAGFMTGSMASPEGAYHSAFVADSEGEEGKYYVWTAGEIDDLLGPQTGAVFRAVYGATDEGNFEGGTNVLHEALTVDEATARFSMARGDLERLLASARRTLLAARDKRVPPLLDDKILTDWNGLAIAALSRAGRVFGRPEWIEAAEGAAAFVARCLDGPQGLMHRYRGGTAGIPAFLDDYAFLAWGHAELGRASGAHEHVRRAAGLLDSLELEFSAPSGGFYQSRPDDLLFMRRREAYDGAIPSGNAVAMAAMALLAEQGMERYAALARRTGGAFAADVERAPLGHTHLLAVALTLPGDGRGW